MRHGYRARADRAAVAAIALAVMGLALLPARCHAQAASSPVYSDGALPDPGLTPGAVRTTDKDAICNGVLIDGVRVPLSKAWRSEVKPAMKQGAYRRYGMATNRDGWCASERGCEVDHLISLELGGDPTSPLNLWPQPYDPPADQPSHPGKFWNAVDKDKLENGLKRAICAGKITVEAAQREIAVNWIAAYEAGLVRSEAWHRGIQSR
jgi:hypothetical protein